MTFTGSGNDPRYFNRYAYSGNDPINHFDPDGQAIGKIIKFVRNTIKHKGNPIKGGADTVVGIGEDLGTLLDGQLNMDDAAAVVSLVTGLDKKDQAAIRAAAKKTKKSLNKLKPDPKATGDHTTFKTDADGNITRHETWTKNDKNPSGFDSQQSTDMSGKAHRNKTTGDKVPTPHTQGKDIPGGVRPATPDEIPKQRN